MTQVCDFSNQHINLAQVKSNGFAGIISYVSDTQSKNLTQSNFNQALATGLTVTLVCEQGQQQALRGTAGGQHDASIANSQANTLGYDHFAAIYYVAEDPSRLPTADWPTVEAYFRALSGRPRGAYGGLNLVTHLIDMGLATYGWVVQTWGGINNQVHLEQLVGAPTFGLPIDVDNVLQADYGQMPRPTTPNGDDVPAPQSVVSTWYPDLSNLLNRFDLHADGGLFSSNQTGANVGELKYVAMANTGAAFLFPDPGGSGAFSYPGLPAASQTLPAGAYFTQMIPISYAGVAVGQGPAGPPGPQGPSGDTDVQPKLTAAAAGLEQAATALQ